MSQIVINNATIQDAGLILAFIRELAKYEKAEDQVVATIEDIQNRLFASNATARALICTLDGKAIGFAVYFFNFSTWLGKNGLYLEDLYISPDYRAAGAGKKLIRHLAQIAVNNHCGRFEWNVLDWNTPAIKFYESIGAKPLEEWITYRLEGKALADFAGG
ncbi:MAG: GNAT family N-acetyltransferase [Cellvibrionaceae bacterium]|nr:GNAT family N-acetyltransferase [Cellvibrionaceae bacterium]